MANITAQMVKALREQTGVGMMDCKAALTETGGDMAAAVDWLRARGLSKAAKKAGRVAAEGLIGVAAGERTSAMVEVNSETDFVARNEAFQEMVRAIAGVALAEKGDIGKTAAAPYPGTGKPVADHITEMIGTIGENMTLRRAAALEVGEGVVASYVHNAVADGLGRIGVIVALESAGDAAALGRFGRQIAMHIAAANPLSVTAEDLDAETVARERAVLVEQARQSGRPDGIIEKMVEGRLRKYYEEVVLLSQAFVIDGERTVAKAVEDTAGELGQPITVKAFVRMALGEGIERDQADFAAEVAAAAGG